MKNYTTAIIDYFKSEQKIEFLNNLIQGYSAGRAFNKVVNIVGNKKFCDLFNKGNALSVCLLRCDYIDQEEYNILITFEKNGDIINGLHVILDKIKLNRFYFKELFSSILLSAFYAIVFILVSILTQFFTSGLSIMLILKSIVYFIIFGAYVFGVIYLFQIFFDSSFILLSKISTLKSLIKTGKGFEEIKNTFRINNVKTISELVSRLDNIDLTTISAIKTAEVSGSLDFALENRLKILKEKFKSKIKRFKIIISGFSYALIVFIIIINIFKNYFSMFSV